MQMKALLRAVIVAAGIGAELSFGAVGHALAQSGGLDLYGVPGPAPSRIAHRRPRIDISPRPLLYRRCVDWYELQYRPSGTVLYPQMRCWWVRG